MITHSEFPADPSLLTEPFSRRGSYLSIRRYSLQTNANPKKLGGVWLRQHHGHGKLSDLLAEIRVNGEEPASVWDEAKLTLHQDGNPAAGVEIVFDGTRGLRFRGRGCSMRLSFPSAPGAGLYPVQNGNWELNARACQCKLMLRPVSGEIHAHGAWEGESSSGMELVCDPDAEGGWELGLEMFQSTWISHELRPFEVLEAEVRNDFAAFLEGISPAQPEWEAARVRASYVNWSAIVGASGHFRRPAMLMSKNNMANVWSWDHAFNAIALLPGHPELALDQMRLMADRQNEFGAFPDAQNDMFEHFNFCKPPIHGWAVSIQRRLCPEAYTEAVLEETLRWLEPWTRWWLDHRMWPEPRLPYYLHGNDSGWDNSTFFLKGVPMLTPDLPCFLALQCGELAEIHSTLGREQEAEAWRARAGELREHLLATLWNGERFVAMKVPEQIPIAADTLIETMPLVLGADLPEEIRAKVIGRLQRYLTPHGLATEYPESPHYRSDGYWRGPIWAPSTLLIYDGLVRAGEDALAETIRQRFLTLCVKSGFAENFDALTGAPLRDKAYTWTSSVFLYLQ
jgi:putative isomerase